MKKAVDRVVVSIFLFLLFLSFSGGFEGVVGQILYALAFLVPLAIGWYLTKETHEDGFKILPSGKDFLDTLPFFPITVALVFLFSFLTSAVLGALGLASEVVLEGGVFRSVLSHALLPALLEELLFRYLPIKALSRFGRGRTILLSALFFSLAHGDLFQIPYAFVAGVLFALIDILSGSLLPSLLLHFINNVLGVLWIYYGESTVFTLAFLIILATSALLGALFIYLKRAHYLGKIKPIIHDPCQEKTSYSVYILIALCLFLSITNLLT